MSVTITRVSFVGGCTGEHYIVRGYEDGLPFRREVVPGLEGKQPSEIQKAIEEFKKPLPICGRCQTS